MRKTFKRYGIALMAGLPFFAMWVFIVMSYARLPVPSALVESVISMGSASLLGIVVWHVGQHRQWPLRLNLRFYLFHIFLASLYAFVWNFVIYWLESLRHGNNLLRDFWKAPIFGWQLLMGIWIYGLFAGVSYAVQTRNRLHEKENLAMRAQALATAARLDALRARLNLISCSMLSTPSVHW